MPLQCLARIETWSFKEPFEIARGVVTDVQALIVELSDGQGLRGRGEAIGVPYDGETPDLLLQQIDSIQGGINADTSADELARWLPPGGARNALDCALWDLRAKSQGKRAWQLAGMHSVSSVTTAFTIGLGSEAQLRRKLLESRHMPIIKLKADATRHVELARIARELHPSARLIIDANQAWDRPLMQRILPELHAAGVELIEQPVRRGDDAQLLGLYSPIPLAADESCTDAASLDGLVGYYDFVNIKLDKTGGLSEALALVAKAKTLGFGLMVGNMCGTSLGMAPAFLVAQHCHYIDLDGPLIMATDREHAMAYEGASLSAPAAALWG